MDTDRIRNSRSTMMRPWTYKKRMRRVVMFLQLMNLYHQMVELIMLMMQDLEDMETASAACILLAVELASIVVDRSTPVRIENYVERTIPGQTAKQFQDNFRMTPDTFEIILRDFSPRLVATNKFSPVTRLMDPRKQLLAVLWLLATPDSYRSVAERFNMGKSSLHRSFVNVVRIINTKSRHLIRWPQAREEPTAEKFKQFASIPGVIGAIDGSYIPIKAPEEYPERYINRKCYHAITLQAICDADLMFTDVFTGYPSSVSDKRIFVNSDIYKKVSSGRLNVPPDYFIIGDKAYPVLKWCIPPYIDRGRLTNQQKRFNEAVASTRQCIERAFALLKGRFRRLKYLDMSLTHLIPAVILASCVLHNICLLNGCDRVAIEQYIKEGRPNVDGEEVIDTEQIRENESEGNHLRDRIMRMIPNNE